jgi:predicted nucleic acid-binding protein
VAQAKLKAYVETSVISYLVARRNQRDLIVAANQELTVEWWERRREDFELYVSAVVLAEVARGDEQYAAARTAIAQQLPIVEMSEQVAVLADALIERAGLPSSAYEDALHIAAAPRVVWITY